MTRSMGVEDTSKRDVGTHLAGALTEGTSGYITGMEAQGQRDVLFSDLIPTRGADELVALGFVLGDVVDGDPLFRYRMTGHSRTVIVAPDGTVVQDGCARPTDD